MSVMDSTTTSTPMGDNDLLLKEEHSQAEPFRRKGIEDRADVLAEVEKAASRNEIIMIDDDDYDPVQHHEPLPMPASQLAAQAFELPQEVSSSRAKPSTSTTPKKTLFGRDFSLNPSIVSLDLPTPPASDTQSPQHRSTFGVNAHAESWSFENLSESAKSIFSSQSPEPILQSRTETDSTTSTTASGELDNTKKQLEQQGLQRSKHLRQRKIELKKSGHSPRPQQEWPFSESVKSDRDRSQTILQARDQGWDISSSDDEDISKAWDLKGEASGRLTPGLATKKPNPYSRTAANEYRTQHRHLENPTALFSTISSDIPQKTENEQRQADERLNRIKEKNQIFSSKKRKWSPPPAFHTIDLSGQEKRPRLAEGLTKMQSGATDIAYTNITESPNHSDWSQSNGLLSTISDLQRRVKAPVKATTSTTIVQEKNFEDMFPVQDSEILLTKSVQKLTGSHAEASRRRNRYLERSRDLNSIFEAAEKLALLLTITDTTAELSKWIDEVKLFSKAVLDEDRSGKLQRKRVDDIRHNAIRRMNNSRKEPCSRLADVKFSAILTDEHATKLRTEIPLVNAAFKDAQAEAKARSNDKHEYKKKACRAVRAQPKIQSLDGRLARVMDSSNQATRQDMQIVARRELLAMHDAQVYKTPDKYDNVETMDLDFGMAASDDNDDDDVSEEDEGEDYMRPTGVVFSKNTQRGQSVGATDLQAHVHVPNVSSFAEIPKHLQPPTQSTYTGTQQADPEIIKRMQEKAAERLASNSQRYVMQPPTDHAGSVANEAESDSESEDLASNAETDTEDIPRDEDGNAVCRQYTVKVITTGLGTEDENELVLYESFRQDKAWKILMSVQSWFQKRFELHNPNIQTDRYNWNQNANKAHTECTQTFEYDLLPGRYGYHASLTSVELTLNHAAYEKAKTQKVLKSLKLWVVDWEKTIEPYQESPEEFDKNTSGNEAATTDVQRSETDIQNASNDVESQEPSQVTQSRSRSASPVDDMQSLFGDSDSSMSDPTPPSTCTSVQSIGAERLVERMHGKQLRIFTDIARANRHAKEVFVSWHHRALPGRCNEDFHRNQDEKIENELKDIGDMYLWERRADCIVTNEDGTRQVERMHVWVERHIPCGATN